MSWRLADALGYAAFSIEKPWTWDELVGVPCKSQVVMVAESQAEMAKKKIDSLIANALG